jgi:HSP20 family molecular chaperone IbpA
MFPLIRPVVRPEPGLAVRRASRFGLWPNEMEAILERFLPPWAFPAEWFRETPPWTVTEAEKEVVYRMPLPGFELSEIEVRVIGNEMFVRAEHRTPEGVKENRAARPEENVELTMTLPAGLEPEKMEASFRNGLLEVHVPRMTSAVPRRVEVRTLAGHEDPRTTRLYDRRKKRVTRNIVERISV